MKLKSIHLKNFRRFTDLTVEGLPPTAKLIILAGPNGCGKSSFFDALNAWHGLNSQIHPSWDENYHAKASAPDRKYSDNVSVEFHEGSERREEAKRKLIYIRSAYRNDPTPIVNEIKKLGDPFDAQRAWRMVDNDAAISRNYQRLTGQTIEELFDPPDDSITIAEFKKQIIGDIKVALGELLPGLELNSLGNPLEEGTFHFTKGTSAGFQVLNLSGGEKAIFDLVLDLVVAKRKYDDTVFCIDEPESHLHTRLQSEALSTLYKLIPDENCQLMLATHSIGMMRRARDIERECPGSVVFLNFDVHNFDEPVTITPTEPIRPFWERVYKVALDDLATLVAPERVVVCEGYPKSKTPGKNHSLDAGCYNKIFETEFPETRFVSMGGYDEVINDKWRLKATLGFLFKGMNIICLIDRDDRSDEEKDKLAKDGVRVLSLRNLESYLFDDEVLRALAKSVGKEDKADELIRAKQEIVKQNGDHPADDLKPVSGEIYRKCKHLLQLSKCGNKPQSFMRDTLAPLIQQEMEVYQRLRNDIFGDAEQNQSTQPPPPKK